MANNQYKLQFIADLDLGNMKQGLNQLQGQLNKLNAPRSLTKSFNSNIESLRAEIKNVESLSAKGALSKKEASSLFTSYEKIDKIIRKINVDAKDLSSIDLSKLLPEGSLQRFEKINAALRQLQSLINIKSNIPTQLTEMGKQAEQQKTKIAELSKELDNLNQKRQANIERQNAAKIRAQELKSRRAVLESEQERLRTTPRGVNSAEYVTLQRRVSEARTQLAILNTELNKKEAQLTKAINSKTTRNKEANIQAAQSDVDKVEIKIEAARRSIDEMESRLRSLRSQRTDGTSLKAYQDNAQELQQIAQGLARVSQEEQNYKAIASDTGKEITKKNTELQKETERLKELDQAIENLRNGNGVDQSKIDEIKNEIQKLSGLTIETNDLEELQKVLNGLRSDTIQEVNDDLQTFNNTQQEVATEAKTLGNAIEDERSSWNAFDDQLSEINALKSRIQYFFGLNNTIELVKRTIRSAFETVKELDKAMTETAVVTDFSVADMWAQLPDYTKRANDLGVTTKAAYEAATLYYQQGLKTNEVTAMSNETLKMARIAGLDAAVATDRMTNAIRGFNMEINEMNAQRIDDVYSKLAAISASNVDEISTAMTKVASLANNANMEFETTSAFLAQIIETTRESAETAGTALKTVVARFSEVKKLVSEDQLKGQDEEGQLIDVNKVSEALRTAGVDLNKYFLGEVGLDDIFMELASKWDSLTTLQQRYIATQAAGSRQQSRFIALMSDYGRMQELVGEAYNANGAAAEQFAKTQDSLESKLARLKNAWNEFAMGIANSDLVKAGVDFLTLLLNSVNKLTDGFGLLTGSVGGFVSSILKLGLLIGGLNLGKNLIGGGIGGIGSLLKGESFGAGFGDAIQAKDGKILKAIFGSFGQGISGTGSILGKAGKGIFTGISNFGSKLSAGTGVLGKTAWGINGGLQSLLSGSLGFEAAGSIGGFAAALGTIAPIAIAATVAVKKLYDLSPTGQVKIAEKYAENIGKIADEAKKTEASLKDAQTKYKEYSQAISNNADIQGYSKAVQDRNEYLTSLLEQDASFAKYIQSEVKNGELVLSIDEDAFANAIAKAEENTKNLKVDNLLAQANLAAQKADLANANRIGAKDQDYNGNFIDTAKSLQYASQQQLLISESQAFATQAAQEILDGLNISDEIANSIATSYGKMFDSDKFQEDLSYSGISGAIASVFDNAVGLLDSKYEAYYGADSAKGLTRAEKVAGISAAEQRQGYEQELSDIAKAVSEDTSGQVERLFKAMSGDIDLSDEELESPKLEAALEKLTTALGKDLDQTKTQIKQAQEQRKELRQAKATNIYSQALQSGKAITSDYRNLIDTLDFDRITGISNILDSVKGKIDEDLFSSLFDSLPEMGESTFAEFSDFFKSFNLDAPIQAFKQLQDAKEKALEGSEFSKVLNSLEEVNAATFETSNLFKSFYQSDAYDSISDSLADFIEENGKISGENIEELAASCSDLDVLLNDTSLTAEGLARALNSLSDGTLSIDSLTNSVLAAISVGQDYESLLNEIHKTISDFDPGLDTGEGSDFIVEQAKNLNELIEGYEFGNEQTKNIYNKLFGEDAYQAFMSDWGEKGVDEFATEAQNRIQQLSDWAENNSYGFMKQFAGDQYGLGITQTGDYDFEWDISQFESTDAVLQKIMETANVSKDTAEMLFSGFAAQSYDLQEAWNKLDYKTKLDAFANEIQNKSFVTKEELNAIGKAMGKSSEEVLRDLQKLREEKGINIPVVVGLKDSNGNDLTGGALKGAFKKAFRTDEKSFKEVAQNYAKQFEVALEDGSKGINADALLKNLTTQGFSPEQATELADSIVKTTEDQLLTKTIKIPKLEPGEDGAVTVTSEDVVITADSMAGLTAAENAAMEAANYDLIAQNIAEGDFSGITDSIKSAVETAVSEAGGKLSTLANSFNGSTIQSRILSAVNSGISQAKTAFANAAFKANVALTFTGTASGGLVNKPNANNSGGRHTGKYQQRETTTASGGIVKSSASGNRLVAPGISLTGEEDPEIVWNKEQGYAYITGKNGPEFQNLQPGDRVFNADETKKILKRSKENKTFSSFAGGVKGSYSPKIVSGAGTGSSSKTSAKTTTNSEKTSDEWKNELDWLYNLMEDIAESERTQEKLATKHERYLKDATKTGKDLYNITKQQMQNLNQQYAYQKQALAGREKEMQEQINQSGYTDYVWWNNNDRTIEINWDKIEGLQDKDTYDKVSELVSKAEDIQSKIDAAEDALRDIEGQMGELQERYIQEYIDFEQTVLQAVVSKYQETIDELSSLDDTLNKANDDILNSIRKEIDLQRQIRDNTDTEKNINDMETRLAYLRRDTTGANQNEILQLEKQIREARQGYSDTLVDQSLDRLSEANEEASEQRQHQIELLTEQLKYWQDTGALWPEVWSLMQESIDAGYYVLGSKMDQLIKESENFQSMSKEQQDQFITKMDKLFKPVLEYLLEQEHPTYKEDNDFDYGKELDAMIMTYGAQALEMPQYERLRNERHERYREKYILTGEKTEEDFWNEENLRERWAKSMSNPVSTANWDETDYMGIMLNLISELGSNALNDERYIAAAAAREAKVYAKNGQSKEALAKARKEQAELDVKALALGPRIDGIPLDIYNDLMKMSEAGPIDKLIAEYLLKFYKTGGFASGGLTTKTGPAWLDGTPSAPEYVLNARQTDAFLRLAEVLPSALGRGSSLTNTIGGNVYLELTMNVGEIGSDYDVDRLVDRVKQDIYDASAYRNINVISSIR